MKTKIMESNIVAELYLLHWFPGIIVVELIKCSGVQKLVAVASINQCSMKECKSVCCSSKLGTESK